MFLRIVVNIIARKTDYFFPLFFSKSCVFVSIRSYLAAFWSAHPVRAIWEPSLPEHWSKQFELVSETSYFEQ